MTQLCLHTCIVCAYFYRECALPVCLQVQNELSQKTEKLHAEVCLKQQLSEEYEQVSVAVVALSKLLIGHRATVHSNQMCVCSCCNVQAQRTILELQAQLDLLKDSESLQADTEDVAQLKVGQRGLSQLYRCR